MAKLTIQLVLWNGKKYLPYLFESLHNQTYKDFHLIVLDNGSTDGSVEEVEDLIGAFQISGEVIRLHENIGFAKGHNMLFRTTDDRQQTTDYILLLNQDMYLEKDCLEKMVKFLDTHQDIAGVAPRLMKWGFDDAKRGALRTSFTDMVDSLGLKVFCSRRVVDAHMGETWSEIKSIFSGNSVEVFGVSGALPMFRREALEAVVCSDGTVFDELYHSYKEDVDLAYRLRSAGYRTSIVLDAVAYHDRSSGNIGIESDVASAKNKMSQSEFLKYYSYRNHLLTLYKNEYWQNLLLDFFPILWYEGKKFVWFLLFDRKVLRGLKDVWRLRMEMGNKKLEMKKKISWREMRKWF